MPIIIPKNESPLFVIYDVEADKIRNKMHDTCKDYGLRPVQFSVMLGTLTATKTKELFAKLKTLLGEKPGTVLIIPVCREDFRKILHTGEPLGLAHVPFVHFV
ncbi:CRISPR-associated endonuclease Cas2 [candidate division KSB1 bacterium]|nr:CRISPR-associated endonuclease Cas2 [candidate division KSB1 bacterium]